MKPAVSLPEVTTEAIILSARSWLLVCLAFFFRFAAAVAGVFPIVFLVGILLRIFISAPIDMNGDPDPIFMGKLFFSEENSMLAISGVFAAVFLIQMVLYSLMDAGIVGEIGRAIKEDGKPRVKGFGISAVKLFPQILSLRLLSHFLGILCGLAFLAFILLSLNIMGFEFFTQKVNFYSFLFATIAVLSFISVFYALFLSVFLMGGISVSLENSSISGSLKTGLQYLTENSVVISFSLVFLLLIFVFHQIVGVLGGLWWAKIINWSGGADVFLTASSAWDLAITLMSQIIWVFAICFQMILFYKLQLNKTPQ